MYKRKEFKEEKPKLYVAEKDRKKVVETIRASEVPVAVAVEEPIKDDRLDEVVPLLVDMIGRLLSSGGMMRYRSSLISKTKEIMREKETKKAK